MVALSSEVASIAGNNVGGLYAYRASKSALNAILRSMSVDLKPSGVTVLALHPGWARTDMGGEHARVDPVDSAKGMQHVIANLKPEESGRFMSYQGIELQW